MSLGGDLGVYVHFPWCLQKCPYCDFLSVPGRKEEIPHRGYTEAVLEEYQRRTRALELGGGPTPRLRTLFFGGGTPSLWDPECIARVIDVLRPEVEAETTVECNPSSFTKQCAQGLKRAGVSRISLGVQGLDDERLQFLGRLHAGRQGLDALELALATGFERVSADFIYGIAGQSPEAAASEARALAASGVTHLSAYMLTIEPGTVFGSLHRQHRLPLLSETSVADSFLAVRECLQQAGFEHYEISNFAKSGHYAEHNLGYWRGDDYLGLGTGAWGTVQLADRRVRYRNTPAVARYLEALANTPEDSDPNPFPPAAHGWVSHVEYLTPEAQCTERLMLGLRTREGVELAALPAAWGRELLDRPATAKLLQEGQLRLSEGRLQIPEQHWLWTDTIVARLI